MPYLSRHGTMKPPLGAQIDPTHPLAQGLIAAVVFNEGQGIPFVLPGPGATVGRYLPNQLSQASGGFPATWVSSREGLGQQFSTNQTYWLSDGGHGSGSDTWIPTTAMTVCVIRRKTDTTNRAGAMLGINNGAHDTRECTLYCPFSNGSVLFDFGGTASPNRLTVAGLSFSTVTPERFVFHAGPAGSALWQNGVKVGSQATAISRTGTTVSSAWEINGPFGGDNQEFYYLAAYNVQWSDDRCRWWSAEPYDHLWGSPMTYPGPSSSALLGATAGASSVVAPSGHRSGFGSQKPSRRLRGRRV